MPILTVEIVGLPVPNPLRGLDDGSMAQSLADVAGEIFDTRPGGTWVKVHRIPQDQYAENSESRARVSPVFVSVLAGASYDKLDLEATANALADAFADLLERPKETIHIVFEPNAKGRIAFGGALYK